MYHRYDHNEDAIGESHARKIESIATIRSNRFAPLLSKAFAVCAAPFSAAVWFERTPRADESQEVEA